MRRLVRPSIGIIGQLLAILLLAGALEFATSAFLYERASQVSVRDDEARRLAEHLVIARRLVAERPPAGRAAMAAELTTDRYLVGWRAGRPARPRVAPSLDGMRAQVIAWEPSLADTAVRLWLANPGRGSDVAGELRLKDGSWLSFQTLEPVAGLSFLGERVMLALIPAAGLMLLAGLAVRRVVRPLRGLALAAERAGPDNWVPVPESGPRELRRLIHAFNGMQSRIRQLLSDRTEALAAVGHDLRTPLARLRLRTETVPDPEARAAMESDLAEMEYMVASVLTYLRADADPELPAQTDLAVLCQTLVDEAADEGRDAQFFGPAHLEVWVRPMAMKRALANLIGNALKYGGQAIVIMTRTATEATVAVEDHGPGLKEEELDHVLQPFVRGAAERPADGFGLGLAIAARAIERDEGRFRLFNRPAGGLCAEIVLPLASNISLQAGPSPAKRGL